MLMKKQLNRKTDLLCSAMIACKAAPSGYETADELQTEEAFAEALLDKAAFVFKAAVSVLSVHGVTPASSSVSGAALCC